ncbi:major facilitator superfamily domain-containing protein [Kockovaella imperatae]|uniref:Major facilitator superfamily domain-containing protein n=1 Tax=Kockovaella imperatae TaxID=4999 RepID=A0A1Y1UPY0_9TREE|nr:major facilitator superfamily domain-containing protein [Kockovaella imperatae]ORX39564.1 major facilitator superfamily domain-containing protein [Kockovaella imperatae]
MSTSPIQLTNLQLASPRLDGDLGVSGSRPKRRTSVVAKPNPGLSSLMKDSSLGDPESLYELNDLGLSTIPVIPEYPTPLASAAASVESLHDPNDTSAPFIAALPPVDTGRDAWLFLIGATTCEMLIYGVPFSIGVLHLYWTEMYGAGSESTVTLASTLQTGLLYFSSAVFGPLLTSYPFYTKQIQYAGAVIAATSFIGAGFASKPWHLVLTMGCLYPFAGATYMPCAALVFEWFFQKRGLATGILFSGTGVGGATIPFLISFLLARFGYRATMVSIGIGYGLILSAALVFVKRRVPLGRVVRPEERRSTTMDWRCLKTRTMLFSLVVILLTSLANFVPSLWIPTFAEELQVRRPTGTGLIAIMNAASVPGAMLTGLVSDHIPVRYTVLLCCGLASLSCAFLWGFAKSGGPLVAFALLWGLSGLSFVGSWSKIVSLVSGENQGSAVLVFSIFTVLKGIGNFSSGPLSAALLKVDAFRGTPYGFKNYGVLLVYTGGVMMCGAIVGVGLRAPSTSR